MEISNVISLPKQLFQVYGLRLHSDFPLSFPLEKAEGNPDIYVQYQIDQAPNKISQKPIYQSSLKTERGDSVLEYYRLSDKNLLSFPDLADFYLTPPNIHIRVYPSNCLALVEVRLLGNVLALWLEQSGIPVLHAASVTINHQAIAFMSSNTGGKTSLAASFMQAGVPLLTDDLLPLEATPSAYQVRPGYPAMRMWQDAAQYFTHHSETLKPVIPGLPKLFVPVGAGGFGTFDNVSRPLHCIYLPERRAEAAGAKIQIEPLSPAKALIEIIRYSFSPHLTHAAGLAAERLQFFTRLVEKVPVRKLFYPPGFDHLSAVREAILKEL